MDNIDGNMNKDIQSRREFFKNAAKSFANTWMHDVSKWLGSP